MDKSYHKSITTLFPTVTRELLTKSDAPTDFNLFADGSYAEEECGVAGLNLCIGECADIADLSVLSFELAFLDHSVELHTCMTI